jgi:hypothetical protein
MECMSKKRDSRVDCLEINVIVCFIVSTRKLSVGGRRVAVFAGLGDLAPSFLDLEPALRSSHERETRVVLIPA